MKDIVVPQSKDQYEKGSEAPKRYIINEASVRLQTSEGERRYPPGTLFCPKGFRPAGDEHKIPPGVTIAGIESTEEAPLRRTIHVDWGSARDPVLWESEPTLRRKIAKAEVRAAMLRAIAVGAAAGTAVAILQGVLPVVGGWLRYWSGIVVGLVVGVIHANPQT